MKKDLRTGLPLNAAGRAVLFHGTTKARAAEIRRTRRLISAGEPRVYLTTDRGGAGYGDGTVIKTEIDPAMLELDDEFPGGRKDFSVPVGRAGLPIKIAKP